MNSPFNLKLCRCHCHPKTQTLESTAPPFSLQAKANSTSAPNACVAFIVDRPASAKDFTHQLILSPFLLIHWDSKALRPARNNDAWSSDCSLVCSQHRLDFNSLIPIIATAGLFERMSERERKKKTQIGEESDNFHTDVQHLPSEKADASLSHRRPRVPVAAEAASHHWANARVLRSSSGKTPEDLARMSPKSEGKIICLSM